MRHSLRAQLTKTIALIVLITIASISFFSNWLIRAEFEKYAQQQQEVRSGDIVANLASQYNAATGGWDAGYVHGVGMSALYEGYVVRLYDGDGVLVWDAENHDMTLCMEIMEEIAARMETTRPNLDGDFISAEYDLAQDGQQVGTVAITYYGPYFLSESDVQFLDSLNLVLMIVGSLSLLSALAAGRYQAKRIARPVAEAAQAAKLVSEGRYDTNLNERPGTTELEELYTAVNHMADSLARQECLRKQMTSDIAHELRTPLTAISSYLEAMMDGVWEATPKRLKSCHEEIGRITGLVADMESLAKAESGNLELKKEPVDLLELAHTAGAPFEVECAKKNMVLEIGGESSVVDADRGRISQVIVNLLSNAVKYTPENGYVRVSVTDTPESGRLTVKDNGTGISAEELPLIFERFYRTDRSRNRKTGGSGIGLTIARSIVDAHGGSIEVESEPDHGSRFTVTLPKYTCN